MAPKKDQKTKGKGPRIKDLLTDGVIRMGVQSQKSEIAKCFDWYFIGWFETNF